MAAAGTLDEVAVAALREERLDWRFKAVPAAAHGETAGSWLASRPRLSELGTPLLTLDASALAHNRDTVAAWADAAGVLLAPHGKTTMAPALWKQQLDAGAWGVTLANLPQLRVARAFRVSRLMLANSLVDPAGLAWLSAELDADPEFAFLCWVDSERTVELMDAALRAAGAGRPVDVLVELGGPHGRTGVRDLDAALRVAEAVRRSPLLRLAGTGGYEGAFAHDASADSLAVVDGYLDRLTELHGRLAGLGYETERPVVTAGGSAYPDRVARALGALNGANGPSGANGPNGAPEVDAVLRSGAYLIHDDGFYRGISPFGSADGRAPGTPRLRAGMHGWARVVSHPEPELALLDAGKRDLPFDEGLPEPQLLFGAGRLTECEVSALNDQHAFLTGPGAARAAVGDVLRLGLSHPCTAFDKWSLIPVLDDADSADPVVVDLVRTWF
ncbi:alanine racemase [Phaeacidiphilus oryzae]|uniref:alanine racemase n=1 Tax=Phaeacidiphilus oryzae TaxID=348818 RepID=UPI00055B56FA|nr:alanine racemase [Phaeacidiphilus oryzae]